MWNSFMYENLKTTVERAWNDRELDNLYPRFPT